AALLPSIAAESIQERLMELGVVGPRFEAHLATVEESLGSTQANTYAQVLEDLGRLLGFLASRPDGSGAPDCVWSLERQAFIAFEAKTQETPEGSISLATVRQAQSHLDWLRAKEEPPAGAQTKSIIVTPRTTLAKSAAVSADGLVFLHVG